MDGSLLHSHIKAFIVTGATMCLAVYLGFLVGSGDYELLLLGTAIVIGCLIWFFSGRYFWVLTIASSFLSGTFPILRAAFTPFHLLMMMGLLKFLVEDIIIRRVRLKLPGRFDLLMIAGFMGVLTYHAINDRFGMRFLGSTVWGGRLYVSVYVGLAAFFVIPSLPIPTKVWNKFPYFVLGVFAFDLLVAVITTIVPSSIYFIYPFYSAVSNSTLMEAIGGPADITERIGAIGNFGVIMLVFILARLSVRRILHPSNFFRLIGVGFASLLVLVSGYRTAVFNALLTMLIAGIRDLRLAVLALLPVIAASLFFVSVVNSDFIELPKQIQRGLAFMPGNWDAEMARDADASNDFRMKVWSLWWRLYFPAQPMLGRGFGFDQEWAKQSIYTGGGAVDYQQMVETGNIHNGLFATVDALGLIGSTFFVLWNIVILLQTFRVSFDPRLRESFALRFLALYLAVSILFYWGGATTVGSFLPGEFALVGLFLRLCRDLKPVEERREVAVREAPPPFRSRLARV